MIMRLSAISALFLCLFALTAQASDIKTIEVRHANGSYALTPPDFVNERLLAAGTAETSAVPTGASGSYATYVNFSSDGCDFKASYAGILTNGTFTDSTGLTLGTGWTVSGGKGDSDGSQTTTSDISQTFTLVEGASYSVTFVVSSYSAGNVRPVVGGTTGTNRSANNTYTETIVAGSTDVLAFRADADFVGKIDSVTIVPVATAAADFTNGGASENNPTTRLLNGTVANISVISDETCSVTLDYFM